MHPALIMILSALSGGVLLALALTLESWSWKQGSGVHLIPSGRGGDIWGRTLSIILVLVILGTLGILGYVLSNPVLEVGFTEFYILGLSGEAADYPGKLRLGTDGEVMLGIINQEHEPATYRIEIVIDGGKNNEIGPMMLEHDNKWEEMVNFTPDRIGDKQKVEFLLYKQGHNEVYQKLSLWVDVR